MAKASNTFIVTIDGPSASGKSSVSRELARRHGWKWVSTGAFYRGLALVARLKNVDLNNEAALVKLAQDSRIWQVTMAEARTEVICDGRDVTDQIYREEVGADASRISQMPGVRKSLLQAQRDCATGVSGLVAEGRDCGTVIFPDAQVKIYLTAGSERRFERRAREEGIMTGPATSAEQLRAAQAQRDLQDSTRKSAPLQVPENAEVIDTSDMGLAEVVDCADSIVVRALRP